MTGLWLLAIESWWFSSTSSVTHSVTLTVITMNGERNPTAGRESGNTMVCLLISCAPWIGLVGTVLDHSWEVDYDLIQLECRIWKSEMQIQHNDPSRQRESNVILSNKATIHSFHWHTLPITRFNLRSASFLLVLSFWGWDSSSIHHESDSILHLSIVTRSRIIDNTYPNSNSILQPPHPLFSSNLLPSFCSSSSVILLLTSPSLHPSISDSVFLSSPFLPFIPSHSMQSWLQPISKSIWMKMTRKTRNIKMTMDVKRYYMHINQVRQQREIQRDYPISQSTYDGSFDRSHC